MIPVDDPSDLPKIVQAWRKALKLERLGVAKAAAERLHRSAVSMESQFWHWESGSKDPRLSSLRDYLDAHGLALALVGVKETPTEASWCPARNKKDPHRSRCAIQVGHAGVHRTYAGEGFW